MTGFAPKEPDFEARVRGPFARQGIMDPIGARMAKVEPGPVEIEVPYRAAFGLFPADAPVLTAEFTSNLPAPAAGRAFGSAAASAYSFPLVFKDRP